MVKSTVIIVMINVLRSTKWKVEKIKIEDKSSLEKCTNKIKISIRGGFIETINVNITFAIKK